MKTTIYSCFKRLLTVNWLIACLTEQLLVFDNSPVLEPPARLEFMLHLVGGI